MQCAEFQGHVGGKELADLTAELGREYNCALMVVERNNMGSTPLELLEDRCRYPRIYRQEGKPGWLTSQVTKPQALAKLYAMLIENPEVIMSGRLLAECRTFVRKADGNLGASSGAHDDLVMAMAMGLAVRASGCR